MRSFYRINKFGVGYKITEVYSEEPKTCIESQGNQILVNASIDSISQAWYDWLYAAKPKKIQDAFHFLSQSEREFILTGITENEWQHIFPDADEDEIEEDK